MTDDELLEYAAMAAGYVEGETFKFHPSTGGPMVRTKVGSLWAAWNPLQSNHTAFELLVKFNLTVEIGSKERGFVVVRTCGDNWREYREHCGEDVAAAARRAIVRAVASNVSHD